MKQYTLPADWMNAEYLAMASRIAERSITDVVEAMKIIGDYNRDQNAMSR